MIPYIIKADKFHVKRSTAECLDDARIRIILLVVNGMVDHMVAPRAHFPQQFNIATRLTQYGVVPLIFSYSSRNSLHTLST